VLHTQLCDPCLGRRRMGRVWMGTAVHIVWSGECIGKVTVRCPLGGHPVEPLNKHRIGERT